MSFETTDKSIAFRVEQFDAGVAVASAFGSQAAIWTSDSLVTCSMRPYVPDRLSSSRIYDLVGLVFDTGGQKAAVGTLDERICLERCGLDFPNQLPCERIPDFDPTVASGI